MRLHHLPIGPKIALSIGLLVAGYGLTMAMVVISGLKTEAVLTQARTGLFPATQIAKAAETALGNQVALYESAVLIGELGTLDLARHARSQALTSYRSLARQPGLGRPMQQKVTALCTDLDSWATASESAYQRLLEAKGASVPGLDPAFLGGLVAQREALQGRSTELTRELTKALDLRLEEVLKASISGRWAAIVVFIGSLLVSGVLLTMAIYVWILRPLAATLRMMQEMGHGLIHLQPGVRDEVLIVGHSFRELYALVNQQISDLEAARNELTGLNRELEDRVARRTSELSSANRSLQKTLGDLQSTQKQLIESEKLAALGGMVAGVAHEINTPLGVALTAASHLGRETILIKEVLASEQLTQTGLEDYLTAIDTASTILVNNLNRAAALIRSFKQVAVDQSSDGRRPFNLLDYSKEIVLNLQPRLKRTGHIMEVTGQDQVVIDSWPGPFSQILTNLITNALEHAFEGRTGGRIQVRIGVVSDGRARIEVADNGCGMDDEVRRQLFSPFFTTKRGRGGTGLGLHISYNLVQRLQGAISCTSQPGQGTIFTIDLPFQPAAPPAGEPGKEAAHG